MRNMGMIGNSGLQTVEQSLIMVVIVQSAAMTTSHFLLFGDKSSPL